MTRWTGAILCLLWLAGHAAAADLVVGSKKFTESVVLGELATTLLTASGESARHRREIGGTRVLFEALKRGDIDIYPEYSGTLAQELLALPGASRQALQSALDNQGLRMSAPLGFANNYALAMREPEAARRGIRAISDLAAADGALRYGFSHEFLDRADGWPGLRDAYGLRAGRLRGLDHDLAYRALDQGAVDVIEVYTTDAEIDYYGLRVLEDDRGHFSDYAAVWLYRSDLPAAAVTALARLDGRIDASGMRRMNAAVKQAGQGEGTVARAFLLSAGLIDQASARSSSVGPWSQFLRTTQEHLLLVSLSLGAALLVALPLGVLAAGVPGLRQVVLSAVGVLQTIPSLALLVIMVPLLGIGAAPAIVALFLYSLLPIVRNTVTGLTGIPDEIRDSARAIGLPRAARLRHVYLPMALPQILAGIKIAAVINVGTATLAALIGAGGYGQPILTGIRLDDTALILWGAVPAAAMALAVQGLFDLAERWLVSPGLRSDTRQV